MTGKLVRPSYPWNRVTWEHGRATVQTSMWAMGLAIVGDTHHHDHFYRIRWLSGPLGLGRLSVLGSGRMR